MELSSDKWCKHYRGVYEHDTCKAGVEYVTLGKFPERPCTNPDSKVPCEKCERKTPEEIAARHAEVEKRFEGTSKARAAIVAFLGGPWKKGTPGARGEIKCPVCGLGQLRFSRAGYNGHIHAACETDGCVSWME